MPPRFRPTHALPDEELLTEIQGRFSPIPEVLLRERELLARFLVPLRADLVAVETYEYRPGDPLPFPITALGGRNDRDVTAEELAGWSAHTRGGFGVEQLEGGHFLADSPRLQELVLRSLDQASPRIP
jgi:surfactin synthase thioesterase subunit